MVEDAAEGIEFLFYFASAFKPSAFVIFEMISRSLSFKQPAKSDKRTYFGPCWSP